MNSSTLAALRQTMKGVAENHLSITAAPISLGAAVIDTALGGGLVRGAVHEIHASAHADSGAATGFAVAVSVRAAGGRPILVARPEFLDTETGWLNAPGLSELGLDPARLILVRTQDAEGALRAGEQAARCASLGAVLIEIWGAPKILNLTASRRLSLAAAKSGVPVIVLRLAASASQSAATTRWKVKALASRALAANAPGHPAFELNLLRHRGGGEGRAWCVEWNRDRKCFQEQQYASAAPLPRSVVSLPQHRPAETAARARELRRTG
jgi:protein ImuA